MVLLVIFLPDDNADFLPLAISKRRPLEIFRAHRALCQPYWTYLYASSVLKKYAGDFALHIALSDGNNPSKP